MSITPAPISASVPNLVPIDHNLDQPNLDANHPHLEAELISTWPEPPIEIGGRPGPDPTRYGDWEKNGRCIDF
jgi:hypothetical protein